MNHISTTIDRDRAFVAATNILSAEFQEYSTVPVDDMSATQLQSFPCSGSFSVTPISYGMTFNFSPISDVHSFVPPELFFRQLVDEWHRECGATSSITKILSCPAYLRIVAMGPDAIPLILRQLESEGDEPDYWFWALQLLTNANPVPNEIQGELRQMSRIWLGWARISGYAW